MYSINWINLVKMLLPPFLRKSKQLAWLTCIISNQITYVYNQFNVYRQQKLYDLSITGQVIYLEKLLNDKYNNGFSGIWIASENISTLFLANKAENFTPIYLANKSEISPIYVGNKSEYLQQYNFIIWVPISIFNLIDIAEMRSLVDKYRIAGKNYNIQSF